MHKKLLLISYYFPPCGGVSVQRWLRLSWHLAEMGIEVHVLTVDEHYASYMQIDKSLERKIHPKIHVHKTKSFEPINYYSRLVGKKNVPTGGFANVDNTKLLQKLVNSLRSHLFIPDPRKGWVRFATKKAIEIIKKENIKYVVTSSPPHSTQLIGLGLKKKCDIRWIVDFRDPWTDIYYYSVLGHSFVSKFLDRRIEKKVLQNADHFVSTNKGCRALFLSKLEKFKTKFDIVTNGFEPNQFAFCKEQKNEVFTICFTGIMAKIYHPNSFLDALKEVQKQTNTPIKLQFVGVVSEDIRNYMNSIDLPFEWIKTVPHHEVAQYLKSAHLLLLISVDGENTHTNGKLFEYIGSKNRILYVGNLDGDTAEIIQHYGYGDTFSRQNKEGIIVYLKTCLEDHKAGKTQHIDDKHIERYTRGYQARQFASLIFDSPL